MLLRDYYETYTKQTLTDIARSLDMHQYSSLRKADLIERIIACYSSDEVLRERMACLTDTQLALFRRACKEPQVISRDNLIDALALSKNWFASFDEGTDDLYAFEEIAAGFEQIDDEAFAADQHKKGWLGQCISYLANYYGLAPIETIYELYRLRVKGSSIEEMTAFLQDMPVDVSGLAIMTAEQLRLGELPASHPLHSDIGIAVDLSLLEDGAVRDVLESQADKAFYIPSAQQIEELYQQGYEADALAYQHLQRFLMDEMYQTSEEAQRWCLEVWTGSYVGDAPTDVMNQMSEEGVPIPAEYDRHSEFIRAMMDAHNNTRMLENRGHKPSELVQESLAGGTPTIVPATTEAADMLGKIAPTLREMGFPVDLDSNADRIAVPAGDDSRTRSVQKIYPNDPCPCGSGKKYKKCCGRR